MEYVGVTKRQDGVIVYEPPAGPTIKEAIINAIEIAKQEKKVATKYFSKLERKYRQPYNAVYHKGIIR